ncbi:hypothetical protein ACFWIW_10995 [Amycolatopsis sp. NPDC058340]|uniref:hypothetical protein n=1 Tax=Amycolatopsis sp. NPDC058340 TaxID=3346453 RepID=UPI003666BB9E
MSARIEVRMDAVIPEYMVPAFVGSPALRAEWTEVAHQGEDGADVCIYRHHDEPHAATIRLTPDPDPDLVHAGTAHVDEMTVCRCCAYEAGHLYEEMRGQCRTSGEVGVELRQSDGRWI